MTFVKGPFELPRGLDPQIEDHCSRDLQAWSGELSVTQELVRKILGSSLRIPEPDPAFQQDAHEIILVYIEGQADLSRGTNWTFQKEMALELWLGFSYRERRPR